MKQFTVISGKGGTGKTTIVSNLAAYADNIVMADCDVDAPNMHLLLQPEIVETEVYNGTKVAVKDEEKCVECGKCQEVCRFGAIDDNYQINPFKCDGCNVCVISCPQNALKLIEEKTGDIYISKTKYGQMIHAKLKAAADNSGKLVSKVRTKAKDIAEKEQKSFLLIDGSPGIGCPVIASLNGVDAAVIVTEPTKSGLSDLKRILKVTKHFNVKPYIIINKFDLNEGITNIIEEYSTDEKIEVLGKIPFDDKINKSLREGKLLIEEYNESKTAEEIMSIWNKLKKI
ncbi:MAG: ATP-binding protein [Halothermotrichaceae bacterium]